MLTAVADTDHGNELVPQRASPTKPRRRSKPRRAPTIDAVAEPQQSRAVAAADEDPHEAPAAAPGPDAAGEPVATMASLFELNPSEAPAPTASANAERAPVPSDARVADETIAWLRAEIGRLMARIDEEILIQAELRDQICARNAEIQRLKARRWWKFWERPDTKPEDPEDEGNEDETGTASLRNMMRF